MPTKAKSKKVSLLRERKQFLPLKCDVVLLAGQWTPIFPINFAAV